MYCYSKHSDDKTARMERKAICEYWSKKVHRAVLYLITHTIMQIYLRI